MLGHVQDALGHLALVEVATACKPPPLRERKGTRGRRGERLGLALHPEPHVPQHRRAHRVGSRAQAHDDVGGEWERRSKRVRL